MEKFSFRRPSPLPSPEGRGRLSEGVLAGEVLAPLVGVVAVVVACHEDQALAGLVGDFELAVLEDLGEGSGDVLGLVVSQGVGDGDPGVADLGDAFGSGGRAGAFASDIDFGAEV